MFSLRIHANRWGPQATLVPNWFSFVFTYTGNNHALQGFFNAIVLVMETGFAVTGILSLLLNLFLAEEIEDEAIPEYTGNEIDAPGDREEWDRIEKHTVQQEGEGEKAVKEA